MYISVACEPKRILDVFLAATLILGYSTHLLSLAFLPLRGSLKGEWPRDRTNENDKCKLCWHISLTELCNL